MTSTSHHPGGHSVTERKDEPVNASIRTCDVPPVCMRVQMLGTYVYMMLDKTQKGGLAGAASQQYF